jgi:hypothetical protein
LQLQGGMDRADQTNRMDRTGRTDRVDRAFSTEYLTHARNQDPTPSRRSNKSIQGSNYFIADIGLGEK